MWPLCLQCLQKVFKSLPAKARNVSPVWTLPQFSWPELCEEYLQSCDCTSRQEKCSIVCFHFITTMHACNNWKQTLTVDNSIWYVFLSYGVKMWGMEADVPSSTKLERLNSEWVVFYMKNILRILWHLRREPCYIFEAALLFTLYCFYNNKKTIYCHISWHM